MTCSPPYGEFSDLIFVASRVTVVTMLNDLFSRFDYLVDLYDINKVKTIGDCYMVVRGVFVHHVMWGYFVHHVNDSNLFVHNLIRHPSRLVNSSMMDVLGYADLLWI